MSPSLFESVFRSLPAAVVVIDGDGIVMSANDAAQAWLRAPLVGTAWRDIAERVFEPRPDDGHDLSLEDGRRVNVRVSPLSPGPGLAVLMNDVSETREREERQAELERLQAMGRTIGAIAHQLRTPLSAALLSVGSLPSGTPREQIVERLQRMEALLEDMLGYARLGSFELERIDAKTLAARLDVGIAVDAGLPYALCTVACTKDIAVWAHVGALLSAIQNLIDNAIAAGATQFELTFATKADLHIFFKDDGPGVAPEVAGSLFEPFVSGEPSGTGLGLSIVRSIAEAHAGSISLHSSAAGACFELVIPAASPTEVAA